VTDPLYRGMNTQVTGGTTTGGTTTSPPPPPPQPINLPALPPTTTAPPPTTMAPQNALTPATPTAPTFGQPIPATMPTFLAGEDFRGSSDVLRGLQDAGVVPSFLRR